MMDHSIAHRTGFAASTGRRRRPNCRRCADRSSAARRSDQRPGKPASPPGSVFNPRCAPVADPAGQRKSSLTPFFFLPPDIRRMQIQEAPHSHAGLRIFPPELAPCSNTRIRQRPRLTILRNDRIGLKRTVQGRCSGLLPDADYWKIRGKKPRIPCRAP